MGRGKAGSKPAVFGPDELDKLLSTAEAAVKQMTEVEFAAAVAALPGPKPEATPVCGDSSCQGLGPIAFDGRLTGDSDIDSFKLELECDRLERMTRSEFEAEIMKEVYNP